MRQRIFSVLATEKVLADCNLFEVFWQQETVLLSAILNSSLTAFFIELSSRSYGGGGGPLKNQIYEVQALNIVNPLLIKSNKDRVSFCIDSFSNREVLSIFEEIQQPDRRELDDIIFDALDLTKGERKAVYEAVVDLVSKRLQKANTISS